MRLFCILMMVIGPWVAYGQMDQLKLSSKKNLMAWHVFQRSENRDSLELAKAWVVEAIEIQPENPYFIDTYANILYKLGNVNEALFEQQRSILLGKFNPVFIQSFYRMKAGIATQENSEAIWDDINSRFRRLIDSAIWQTRLLADKSSANKNEYSGTIIKYIKEFSPVRNPVQLNADAWLIFENSDRAYELKMALSWSRESLKDEGSDFHYAFLDTYANLLYKLGKRKAAIETEERVVRISPPSEKQVYEGVRDKMKAGIKTWP